MSNIRDFPDFEPTDWPEDDDCPANFVSLPMKDLRWKEIKGETKTPFGLYQGRFWVLDHAGPAQLKPGEQSRIGNEQFITYVSSLLLEEDRWTPNTLQFALELQGITQTDLACSLGISRSALSNFWSRETMSLGTDRAISFCLLMNYQNPGLLKVSSTKSLGSGSERKETMVKMLMRA
jgi:hypothetical protein